MQTSSKKLCKRQQSPNLVYRRSRLYPVCDVDSGHFLVLATGWDKQRWINTILFHARLFGHQVIIEEDNFEEGLSLALIAAGIKAEHIVTSPSPDNSGRQRVYQTL